MANGEWIKIGMKIGTMDGYFEVIYQEGKMYFGTEHITDENGEEYDSREVCFTIPELIASERNYGIYW